MRPTAPRAPLGITLLDLLWQLQGAEDLSEEELVEAILFLLGEDRVRLTGTYRDIFFVASRTRTDRQA
jgi:hypothetical protein